MRKSPKEATFRFQQWRPKMSGRVSNMRICVAMALMLIVAACSPRDKALMAGRTAYEHGDYVAAYQILHPLADHGEPEAQFLLGELFYAGKGGLREDKTAAVQWYRRAAEQGFAKAEYAFGWSSFFDEGVPKGTPQRQRYLAAARWMRKAADQNLAPAQSFLGERYERGEGVPEDMVEAAKLYRLAADHGDVDGEYGLGSLLLRGLGIKQDFVWAAALFKKAAVQEIGSEAQTAAILRLKEMHDKGIGPWRSDADMVAWLQQVAALGDINVQIGLARMYETGTHVAKDERAAIAWYGKAADGNAIETESQWENQWPSASAMYWLADRYLRGVGVTRDPEKAAAYLRKAAERNDGDSQFMLGILYMNGDGVPKDNVQAFVWLALARENLFNIVHTSSELRRVRATLLYRLTPQELARAEAIAGTWTCTPPTGCGSGE